MTNYVKMERDFIERTLKIIDQYEIFVQPNVGKSQEYEVTLLMNCLLGLLVYPQQIAAKSENQKVFNSWLTNDLISEVGSEWGILRDNVKRAGHIRGETKDDRIEIKFEQLTLRNLIRQMRNTVAHASFRVNDNTHNIEEIVFKAGDDPKDLHMTLSISDLEKFVRKLADSALKNIKAIN